MRENFEKWLDDHSITEVECLVPDLGGIARGKILPTKKFIQGLEMIVTDCLNQFLFRLFQVGMLPKMKNCP